MKRARLRKRNLTAQTSIPVLAQPGESLSLFKIMSNEIKVGDKVRFNYDTTPRIYLIYSNISVGAICIVDEIQDGNSVVKYDDGEQIKTLVIPTKYLVKVDAEAKESKFKVNDVVRTTFNETTHITSVLENGNYYLYGMGNEYPEDSLTLIQPYIEPTAPKFKVGDRVKFKNIYELQKVKDKSFRWMLVMFASKEATITAVEDNGFYRVDIDPSIGGINDDMIECKVEPTEPEYKYQVGQKVKSAYANEILTIKERCGRVSHDNVYKVEEYAYTWNECELQPCTEPTEQTEAEKTDSDVPFSIFRDDLLSNPQIVNLHNGMHYWQCYEANLAKEVALKVANKYNDPKEAADYAVSVAKSVVEGLKRK